ncbi:MAG: YicC/YloC family endoribonuclease [Lachnospiraceae bacterium]
MIKSMTGFGRYEIINEKCRICVEMKSVNHRYLDLTIKMPRKLNCFETAIRNLLKQDVQRGKVDMFITYEEYADFSTKVHYNQMLAQEYMDCFNAMTQQFGIKNDVTVMELARFPEVITTESVEIDENALWDGLKDAVEKACERFVASRISEGEQLKVDLIEKLDHMLILVGQVEERNPQIIEAFRSKLQTRVTELMSETGMDEARIAAEVTLYADKVCVDEEIVRLKSHIIHTQEKLVQGGAVGRNLDFIVQEMNREANTILSKANDLILADTAIGLKTEIEKIREQIQNIE